MFLYNIIKVLYSPIKAFQEILGNPKFKGPVLIIIISLLLTLGTHYISASKHYVEQITPSNRVAWTNMSDPSPMWASNGNISALQATYEILTGNYTVRTLVSNGTEIWLETTNIETINCSGNSGLKTFYYKLLYIHMSSLNASTATLRLFSLKNESNYFEFDLLSFPGRYINKSISWIDANITVGESASGWVQSPGGSPSWANITGIEFFLKFAESSKPLSLQLNDLYFGGKYTTYLDVLFSDWLALTIIMSTFDFFIKWLILAGLLWLTVKVFHAEGSTFKTLLVIVGYTFAIMLVYVPIEIISVSQLSPIYFPYKVVFPMTAREIELAKIATSNIYAANWSSTAPYSVFVATWYISYAWTAALCTIALRILHNFSWKRASIISIVAIIMALFVRAMVPL